MILDQIIADRKKAVECLKNQCSLTALMREIEYQNFASYSLKEALKMQSEEDDLHIIAEVKKASPSKGLICADFPYLDIAKDYEQGGAAAISVLTEPKYFMGSPVYLTAIKEQANIPILRKDFIIDEWQIYQAKVIGADAILLIVAALSKDQLQTYLKIANSLGLEALVETHDEKEVEMALAVGANIIGVNNRNLHTFEVSLDNTARLRHLVPKDKVFVSESGIHKQEDLTFLKRIGCDAALIGESLMMAPNRVEQLQLFRRC